MAFRLGLGLGLPFATKSGAVTLLTGLSSYYRFDSTPNDQVGSRTLTVASPSDITYSSSAFIKKLGTAGLASGNNDSLTAAWGGPTYSLAANDFTICGWLSLPQSSGTAGEESYIGFPGLLELHWVWVGTSSGGLKVVVNGTTVRAAVGGDMGLRTPTLVGLTWQAATTTWGLWKSGSLLASGTTTAPGDISGSTLTYSFGPSAIHWAVDSVGFWTRALTQADFTQLYNSNVGLDPTA